MKNLCALAGILGLVISANTFACSPAIPVIGQTITLDHVLNSEAFAQELKAQYQNDFSVQIKNIKFNKGLEVTLTNGCLITSHMVYLPVESNGMCPRFSHVVSQTTCN